MKTKILISAIILILSGCDNSYDPGTDSFDSVARDGESNVPKLEDTENFSLELVADLAEFEGFPKAFYMLLEDGSNGFPPGLYISSGPAVGSLTTENDRLFLLDPSGNTSVFHAGFEGGNEAMVFAKGDYGEGMLITAPNELAILRLSANGELSTFIESVGTEPFGLTGMAYDDKGILRACDFEGRRVLHICPDKSTPVFVDLNVLGNGPNKPKGIAFNTDNASGGEFVLGTFSAGEELSGTDVVYSVARDGKSLQELSTGFDGLEFLTFGPGNEFGNFLYAASQATIKNADGAVYQIKPDGSTEPFVTNIDAVHVVFDVDGILGGGMLISDFNNGFENGQPFPAAGRIWRVRARTGKGSSI